MQLIQYILRNYQMKNYETLPVPINWNLVLRYWIFIEIKYVIRKPILKMITPHISKHSTLDTPVCMAVRSRDITHHAHRDLWHGLCTADLDKAELTLCSDKRRQQWESGYCRVSHYTGEVILDSIFSETTFVERKFLIVQINKHILKSC